MAVIGKKRFFFLDLSVLLLFSLLLIGAGRALASEGDNDELTQQTGQDDTELQDQQETELANDDQTEIGGEEDDGDDEETAADDENQDDEQTAHAEGDDEDDEQSGAEDDEGDEDEGAEGDTEDEGTLDEKDDPNTADDEENTVAEDGEEDEQTEADDQIAEENEDLQQTVGDEDEPTADGGEDDEKTVAEDEDEDDKQTVAEGEDEEQTENEDDKTVADEEDNEQAGDDEKTAEEEDDDGQTAEDKTIAGEEDDEQTAGEEDDDVDDDEQTAGDEDDEDEEAVEQAEEEATEDEHEGEEAGDAGTAEDATEAGEDQSVAADEQSGDAGQDAGDEDPSIAVQDTQDEGGDDAASEGDKDGGDGESQADGPEEEEEEQEETVKPHDGRSRDHINEILGLDDSSIKTASTTEKAIHDTLKDLKKMYETAIKPMELLYKFKDISNRFVGDAEIFSKPIILFIGPWSSGKSTIINYLLHNEETRSALRTGAEPQSSGFTVMTYGENDQVLDGTELAADWTFSTLQKFGQSFLDRLRGMKLNNNLLRKVTIVDTPGILENRKIQERTYPFNDACQWFIDRADIIYVVYDPTKLDMGLEMEALFDQLKGRESHVRIVLNKADTVSPQELMRVQSTLLWNLSPLLGSSEPPTTYVGSFWSKLYQPGSPSTLFDAQEEALLYDLRHVVVGRIENKISFTRRHAVRVRNHAKMVDCYLNNYYNHKTFFSNKKKIADEIVENPQNYHIYEGISTLTNVSRYDLPDPDIYRDFFKVNPLYDFKLLSSTCSFFKGCPLDKLDNAISYDLPQLMGKYRKLVGGPVGGGDGARR